MRKYYILTIIVLAVAFSSCKKDSVSENITNNNNSNNTNPTPVTSVTDIDGNVYPTITIGNKIIMAKNLNVSRYRNGDIIPEAPINTWWKISTGFSCFYNNDSSNGIIYGRLYNYPVFLGFGGLKKFMLKYS